MPGRPKSALAFLGCVWYTTNVKLNTTVGAFLYVAARTEKGKRETGANPVRSRHCDKGICRQGAYAPVTEPGSGRRRRVLIFQPGNLPTAGYGGEQLQITRNWLYRKEPAKLRGFFVLPFCTQKGLVFIVGLFECSYGNTA